MLVPGRGHLTASRGNVRCLRIALPSETYWCEPNIWYRPGLARISAVLKMKVEDLRRAAPVGRSGCMRKAARSMRCRAIMRLPRPCAPTSTRRGP